VIRTISIGLGLTVALLALVGARATSAPSTAPQSRIDQLEAQLSTQRRELDGINAAMQGMRRRTATHTGHIELVSANAGILSAMANPAAPANPPPRTETVPLSAVHNTLERPLTVTYQNPQTVNLGTPHRTWTFQIPFPDDFPQHDVDVSILPTVTRLQATSPLCHLISAERSKALNTWNLTLTVMGDAKVERIQISWIAVAVPKQ
jgi:hypothetical protein